MQSSPESKVLGAWDRFTIWLSRLRPLTRLVSLTIALVIFLALLPDYILLFFWVSLRSHRLLASLLFNFHPGGDVIVMVSWPEIGCLGFPVI